MKQKIGMFNPNRLNIARMRRKLTGKELAQRVGLSEVTISRLGKAGNPELSTIDGIAKELNFPKDFFYGNDIDIPTNASFRSLKAMTGKERDAGLSAGSLAYLVSDWVSSKFNLPPVDLDCGSERTPDVVARILRQHWGLGEKPISNVINVLESKGIRVFSVGKDTKNVDAFSCWRNNTPYIFLNTFKTPELIRFDAINQLGHLVLHKHKKAKGREEEEKANKFASFFLIPLIDMASITSLNQLVKEKKRWGVSVSALAYRLHKAQVLSDWKYRTLCNQIKQRITEPNGLEYEKSVVWEKVFKDGITKDQLSTELCIPTTELENLLT